MCENDQLRRQLKQERERRDREMRWRLKIFAIEKMGTDVAFKKLIEQENFSDVRSDCKWELDTTARSIDALQERFEDLPEEQKLRFLASRLNLT